MCTSKNRYLCNLGHSWKVLMCTYIGTSERDCLSYLQEINHYSYYNYSSFSYSTFFFTRTDQNRLRRDKIRQNPKRISFDFQWTWDFLEQSYFLYKYEHNFYFYMSTFHRTCLESYVTDLYVESVKTFYFLWDYFAWYSHFVPIIGRYRFINLPSKRHFKARLTVKTS
jgi:hypothetical protein